MKHQTTNTALVADAGKKARMRKIAIILFLLILYAVGIVHWVLFFKIGSPNLTQWDWSKDIGYYSILKQSLANGTMPFIAWLSPG
jgi:hypothetical protein